MHLMCIDESGDCGLTNSPTRYFVLTGLVVHELRWQTYLDWLIDFRQRMRQHFAQIAPAARRRIGVGAGYRKSIAEGHAGAISVQSELGHETAFTIALPCSSSWHGERV